MLRYRITTPEQVAFRYEIAGLVTRAMAWLLDQLMLWALRFGMAYVLISRGGSIGFAVFLAAWFILDFGYYVFFELYWAGQSLGKRAYKIRVISSRGGRLRFPDVLLRNLLRPIDSLPLFMTVGGVTALIDPLRRRLGDLAADTIVVRDAQATLPTTLLSQQNRVNTFQADPALKNRIMVRVTREERDLILDLMMRRDELEPGTREALFAQAAEYFRRRYALPEGLDYLSDEQTVMNLGLVIQGTKFTG